MANELPSHIVCTNIRLERLLSERAQQGRLTPSDQIALEGTPTQDEEAFTRSRALFNERSTNTRSTSHAVIPINFFLIPANKYNPLYLTAEAILYVDHHVLKPR